MKPSRRLALVLLLLLGGTLAIWLIHRDPPGSPRGEASRAADSSPPAAKIAAQGSISGATTSPNPPRSFVPKDPSASTAQRDPAAPSPGVPVMPTSAPAAVRTPESETGRIRTVLRGYRAALGQNPVGSNPEIARALLGSNPRGIQFLDRSTVTLNAKGELLDDWGNPYFFHAISGTHMEVRSPGPDGKLFTADDVVK